MGSYNFDEFNIVGYSIRQLGYTDQGILQELCEKCSGNENIIVGSSQENQACLVILKELPPGKSFEDKFVLGIFDDSNLIGVLDMVRDFPVKGELILGLMMFDPTFTGKGLRKKIHDCIIKWATNQKFDKLRLDVTADNSESYDFWKNIGYYETKRVDMKLGNKDKEVIVMNYDLKSKSN
jgi:hypothetical protein